MKKTSIFSLLIVFVSSWACQFLGPSRPGTVVSDCSELVSEVSALKPGAIPEHLLMTRIKRGNEFDVNQYFNVLTHISMQDGYALDYVYQYDSLGGYPLLYPRPVDQAPYASTEDIPANTEWPDFHEYLDVEDTEQGYFDYVVMDIMEDQFYLFWHANYNDHQIVCNRQQMYDIVAQVSSSEFGNPMDPAQQAKSRSLRNIVPVVRLTGDSAEVDVVTFTKWGGFDRLTYTISREAPHKIIDIKQENILPYDCGVVF
ncbi:MAG TPA: hypothetical protein VMN99_12960 [Anaerolineales bacterium]|nr:hypothetical protein [Anaerolineales bacterium]